MMDAIGTKSAGELGALIRGRWRLAETESYVHWMGDFHLVDQAKQDGPSVSSQVHPHLENSTIYRRGSPTK